MIRKYKFTILYFVVVVLPFVLYVLCNLYLYVFKNNYVMSGKAGAAAIIAFGSAVIGFMIMLVESWE